MNFSHCNIKAICDLAEGLEGAPWPTLQSSMMWKHTYICVSMKTVRYTQQAEAAGRIIPATPRNHPSPPPFPCSEARCAPGAGHLPLLMTPPRALCVPAEAGGVYGVVRLSPPPQPAHLLNQPACIAPGLRSGLRWLRRSGDDPVGCGC